MTTYIWEEKHIPDEQDLLHNLQRAYERVSVDHSHY